MSYRRWQQLYDRKADGGSLSAAELVELEQLSVHDPEANHELGLVQQLAGLECEPAGDGQRVVERALAQLAALDKVVPIRGRLESRPGAFPVVPREQRRRRWSWRNPALVAALAAAAMGGAALAASSFFDASEPMTPPLAVVVSPEREAVELTLAAGEVFVNGKPGVVTALAVEPRSTIVVGKGRACLAIDTRTDVCLDANTEMVLDGQKRGPRSVRLVRGRVAAALEKRPVDQRFSIVSGGLEVTALGTAFSVETGDSEPARVTVMEGTVRVSLANEERQVTVNEQLRVTQGKLAPPRGITRAERLRHSSLIEVRKLWREPSVSILYVEAEPNDATVSLDGMPLGHAPLSLVAASGKHQLSVDAAAHRAHKQMVDLNPGQTERVTVPPLAPSTTALAGAAANLPTRALAPAASGAPAVPSPGELLARARSLVQAGQWQQAVVAYRKLRRLHPKSPESHTVLVALGQLELDRLGQPAQALGFFNRYLRFGGGLAQEAAFGKVRALRALGNVQLEGKAIEAYVARYPGSADARALRRRLADLGRADSKRR